MSKASIGTLIRRTRIAAGMTQMDVEEACGIPKPRLSRYENGHVVPTIGTVEVLAEALGVPPKTLVGWR